MPIAVEELTARRYSKRRSPDPHRSASKAKRAILYLRVSTVGQQEKGKNLEGQLDECRAYCKKKGYVFNERRDVYRDVVSGARLDRAGYYELLARVEDQDAEVIVAYDVSRIGRNGVDNAWLLVKAKEFGLALEDSRFGEDFTRDPEAEFRYDILSAVAKYERNAITHRMLRGKRTGHKNGRHVTGAPPMGYEVTGPRGARVLKPSSDADLVRSIFARYALGEGANTIAKDLRARGVKTAKGTSRWSAPGIGQLLDNPVYLGMVVFDGQVTKGSHEALVDEETWRVVQVLREKARQRNPGRGGRAAA